MQPPPRTPVPPRASTTRRDTPPSLFSPSYSREEFPGATPASAAAAGGGDQDATISEKPCVTLEEWWLTRVEGDDQKIAVGGLHERNQNFEEFPPATITKRYEARIVETEGGIVLFLRGSLNLTRTIANGYSTKVCENFMIGFPNMWESCNLLYPKETGTGNSEMDSNRFYLERFQVGERLHSHGSSLLSKLLKSVRTYSRDDAAFQKSSHLPNGAPRFEEYTGDGDIAMNENSAASNDDGERHEALCIVVYNADMHMTAGRALRERDGGDIDTNTSLELTMECPNDAANEAADSATPTSTCDQRKAQHAALSKAASKQNEDVPASVCLDVQNSSYLPSRTPSFEEYTCDGDIATNENAAVSNDDREKDEAVRNEVDNVEIHLTADICDIDIDASLGLTMECTNDASNEEADNAPSTSCLEKTGHVALNKKAAVDEEISTFVSLDVQNSSYLSNETPRLEENTCIGDIPTNEDAAALNDNSERCTSVPEVDSVETSFIVGSVTRERGQDYWQWPSKRRSTTRAKQLSNIDDVATNVSLTPTVECTNDAVNEGVDNTSLLGYKITPVASLKSQGCQEKQQLIPSSEKPSGLPKKQRSALGKLQGATRSPLTSPVPYAHDSPLTRGRTTSLSISTPESLKLRKTRSGRVVVPTLDKGCQRIVYDMGGAIVGIVGIDSPSPTPRGSKLEANARKKKRAEPADAGSKLDTNARKKKKAELADTGSKLDTNARKKKKAEPADAGRKLETNARKKKKAEPANAGRKLETNARKKKKAEPADAGSKLEAIARKKKAEPADAGSKLDTNARKKKKAEPADAGSKLEAIARKKKKAEPADAGNKLEAIARKKKAEPADAGGKLEGNAGKKKKAEPADTGSKLEAIARKKKPEPADAGSKLEDDVENSPGRDAHRGKELIPYGVSPADGLFGHNVCEELADGAHSCYKRSAEVSLDGQRHEQRTQHKSLNYDVAPIEVITASNLDVSNPKSSLKGRAKQKRTPLKGRAKRKRATKASSQMLIPKENTGISVPSNLICLEIEKQPTSPLEQGSSGDKVLQGTPRSRMTTTPVSYAHQSSLTRSKSKAPSISTPESVQMKRSRSGRLIVPRLDPGSQNIIYDPDGSICGITNLEAQCPKGISSEPPSKRRSRHLSADHRLLTF